MGKKREAAIQQKKSIEEIKNKAAAGQLVPVHWKRTPDVIDWVYALELQHLVLLFEYHKVDCTSMRKHSSDLWQVRISRVRANSTAYPRHSLRLSELR